ncbi:MAG: class I SAM-dependent methyltransferase [Planctomycetota bacterium]|nr:class I SAM-dependent methyltransferase [Planctomycetota bacterium]
MPADAPPLRAILVADAKVAHHRPRSDLPFYAADVTEGQTVADLGCGNGRVSLQLAEAVGETGRVFCRDISAGRIADLKEEAAAAGLHNVDIAVSRRADVMLPKNSVDAALLADVYQFVINQHETKNAFLESLHDCVKPGGVIVVVYARSSHLLDKDRRESINRQTLNDFIAYGLIPGRRWSFEDERFPAQILEFKKPE